jgi:hypothetical protein
MFTLALGIRIVIELPLAPHAKVGYQPPQQPLGSQLVRANACSRFRQPHFE